MAKPVYLEELVVLDGAGLWLPVTVPKERYLDYRWPAIVKMFAQERMPTYQALPILEASKRNLILVSRVEVPEYGWRL